MLVLLSGKRFVGKDTVTDFLVEELKDRGLACVVVQLANELKKEYARLYNADYLKLVHDREYKVGLISFKLKKGAPQNLSNRILS